jgi:hypothetical protein
MIGVSCLPARDESVCDRARAREGTEPWRSAARMVRSSFHVFPTRTVPLVAVPTAVRPPKLRPNQGRSQRRREAGASLSGSSVGSGG